ncbi:uncharacterized protein LOC114735463 [Neltuma alba]|uniref:uncharacterized protein LOC114735463 n=1 Tax=Neltuma alba TaxID=207710 RepID=UPI0010A40490|nr:uncharacterized protein LOC114735463 [Prosopis alba]
MSVKKSASTNGDKATGAVDKAGKRRRFNRRLSFAEVSLEPGKQLKDMDSNKLKAEIRRWAKAVVKYARQVSGRFGSSRGKSQT